MNRIVQGGRGRGWDGDRGPGSGPAAAAGADAFGRLARLVRSNATLGARLATTRAELAAARAYAGRPGANPALAAAALARLADRHRRLLAALRANRAEADRWLAPPAAAPLRRGA